MTDRNNDHHHHVMRRSIDTIEEEERSGFLDESSNKDLDDEEKGGDHIKKESDIMMATERNKILTNDHNNDIDCDHCEEEDVDDDDAEEVFEDEQDDLHSTTTSRNAIFFQTEWCHSFFLTNALPDDRATFYGVKLVDGPFAVKFLKFLTLTLTGICLMYWFVRLMNWEHEERFTFPDFWTYESTMVVVDSLFFFVVGRMHEQRGVDHVAWALTAVLANVYASGITNFGFLQESVTLYNMHCTWSWALWVFVANLVPLIVTIILWHVHYAVRHGVFVMKVLELLLSVAFLLLPYATSPYLHLHHWYVGWLLGMHCNFNVWWSRATMAWCWGLYINGIAAYGRSPVLTCGYTLYLSKQQQCPYLDCYLDGLENEPNDTTAPIVQEMKTPDWRNCSADAYHP